MRAIMALDHYGDHLRMFAIQDEAIAVLYAEEYPDSIYFYATIGADNE